MEIKKYLILFFIIILASFLRFYNLSSVPPSASLDEATIGYNAYSILRTGADEYSTKFPILLRAYDDFRPALYVYLVVPFVKLFGLNVIAVRLPSVILSVLTVFSVYFLVNELFPKIKRKLFFGYQISIGDVSAFLLAISPWHIYISRLGHEANAALSFGIFAIFFFIKFTKNFKSIYLYLSSVFFALSFYAYQSEKVFIPLLVFVLAILFKESLLKRKKQVLLAIVLGSIILIPVLRETLSPNGLIRLKGTSAFDINAPIYTEAAKERLAAYENGDIVKEIINNNRLISLRIFSENYLSHFNPKWIFTNSGADEFKAPGVGLLYIWEFPAVILGIAFLILGKLDKKIKILFFFWILISPVASSITTGAPHAMRSYNFLPVWQILSSLGLIYILGLLKNSNLRKLFIALVFITISSSVLFFYKQYFLIFPKEQSLSFQYALAKTVPFVLSKEKSYTKIVFSNKDNLYQSYMFFLFYSKYDPILYQMQGGSKSGGFDKSHMFGKYEFRQIDWQKEVAGETLYVNNPEDIPTDFQVIFKGKYLNGKVGTEVIERGKI